MRALVVPAALALATLLAACSTSTTHVAEPTRPPTTTRASAPKAAAAPKRTKPSPDPIAVHAAQAVAYAKRRHVTSGIAVIDMVTGRIRTAGSQKQYYAAASTAKVFTAVLILARHKMTTKNRADMWSMITRSDNDAWHRLENQIGWGHAVTKVEKRYHLNIGREPKHYKNGGGTQVTAIGMARMYAAIKRDKVVWPWLGNAMRQMARRSIGGDDQRFGIPAARPKGGYALKQGWVVEREEGRPYYAVMHSTGYVNRTRYVVCILTRGKPSMYDGVKNGYLGTTISGEATRLLPRGRLA